jgi:hypothetical protein
VFDEFCKDVANQQKLLAAAQAKAASEGFAALLEEAAELERQLRVSLMAQEEGEEGGEGKGGSEQFPARIIDSCGFENRSRGKMLASSLYTAKAGVWCIRVMAKAHVWHLKYKACMRIVAATNSHLSNIRQEFPFGWFVVTRF